MSLDASSLLDLAEGYHRRIANPFSGTENTRSLSE